MKPQGTHKIIFLSHFGRLAKKIRSHAQSLTWRLGIMPEAYLYSILPFNSLGKSTESTISIFDIVTFIIIFIFIIMIVVLVDKQLRTSKRQSLESIKLLEKERNNLEHRISERTLELISARKARTEELERVAHFGELSQGLFHDLIGPLSAVALSIEQLAAHQISPTEAEAIIKKAVDASKRMSAYMDSIKTVISTNPNQEKSAETGTCLSVVLDLLAYKIRMAGVQIERLDQRSFLLKIHPLRLQQLFLNLISNAIEACENTKSDKSMVISIKIVSTKNQVRITILDTGSGIPKNILDNIFNKSFTTKKTGLGIGLMTVRSIVEDELSGTISITNAPIGGALCEVIIPIK